MSDNHKKARMIQIYDNSIKDKNGKIIEGKVVLRTTWEENKKLYGYETEHSQEILILGALQDHKELIKMYKAQARLNRVKILKEEELSNDS